MAGICFQTNIGPVSVREENGAITHISLEQEDFEQNSSPLLQKAKTQLLEYFEGERKEFSLPINPQGTPFQQQVWEELIMVPYGTTVFYSYIAQRIGKPKAVRAVGGAIGKNPITIVIPCHRIIGKSGKLTGFYYGLDVKTKLLELENVL